MNYRFIFTTISTLILLSGTNGYSQNADSWPCFHGPDRNNKSKETGLLRKWPAGGPKLLFTISGLGEGYSTVSFGEGFIFTSGKYQDQSYLFAFDMNGKPVWKSPNGKAWEPTASWALSYTGPRSTPTYEAGRVYYLSEGGRLAVYDAKTGREIWAKDLVKEFDAPQTDYGYAESVYIEGNRIFVRPTGKKGFQVCLDKDNGNLIWANTDITGTEGYSSAVVFDYGGYRHLTGSSSDSYYGVDIASGRLLWKVGFSNERGLNLTDVTEKDGYVYFTSDYGKGSMLVRLKPSGNRFLPEIVWQSKLLDNHHGGVILHDGYLYGSGSSSRGWFCLDFLTGKQMWNHASGKGSITYADGMFYLLDERSGVMSLIRATPEKYELISEFRTGSGGQSMYWAHPVIYGKRLYIRHWDKVFVYDIGL